VHPLAGARFDAPEGVAGSWALDAAAAAPGAATPDEAVYLPGRNFILLTRIQLGVLSSNPFPDATPAFFRSFEKSIAQAIRWPIRAERPLEDMTKTELLRRGAHFDLALTLSCLRPRAGAHCGRCNKCAERLKAFREAGLADPGRYLTD
jgi:7-cyano-7-deazaguanine synthase